MSDIVLPGIRLVPCRCWGSVTALTKRFSASSGGRWDGSGTAPRDMRGSSQKNMHGFTRESMIVCVHCSATPESLTESQRLQEHHHTALMHNCQGGELVASTMLHSFEVHVRDAGEGRTTETDRLGFMGKP